MAVRPVPPTIIGRRSALALAGNRKFLNLTGAELGAKVARAFWGNAKGPDYAVKTLWDCPATSWARGTTMELLVSPAGSKLADGTAACRVSMATVNGDGPFTPLPGYQRLITVVEGNGFRLKGKTEREVYQGNFHLFSGSDQTDCTLIKGPCLDFNVIFKPDQVSVEVELLTLIEGVFKQDAVSYAARKDETILVVCFSGKGMVVGKGIEVLRPYESVRFSFQENGRPFSIEGLQPRSRFALIRIASH